MECLLIILLLEVCPAHRLVCVVKHTVHLKNLRKWLLTLGITSLGVKVKCFVKQSGKLGWFIHLNLALIGVKNVNVVVCIYLDACYHRGKSDTLCSVIKTAEHIQQLALIIIFVNISLLGCHIHVVVISGCHCCRYLVIAVRLNQVRSCDV